MRYITVPRFPPIWGMLQWCPRLERGSAGYHGTHSWGYHGWYKLSSRILDLYNWFNQAEMRFISVFSATTWGWQQDSYQHFMECDGNCCGWSGYGLGPWGINLTDFVIFDIQFWDVLGTNDNNDFEPQPNVCVWDTWDTLPNWSSGVWDVLESSFPEFAVAILPSFVWSVTSLRWPRSAVSQVENHCYPDPQWGCALALHGWRHGPSMVPLSSWNREQMISVLTDVLISKRWMKDLSTPCRIMSKINSNLSWPAGTSPSGTTVLTITRWHFFWTKSATFSRRESPKNIWGPIWAVQRRPVGQIFTVATILAIPSKWCNRFSFWAGDFLIPDMKLWMC